MTVCGSMPSRELSLKVEGTAVEIKFKSDASFNARGFKISYRAYGKFYFYLRFKNQRQECIWRLTRELRQIIVGAHRLIVRNCTYLLGLFLFRRSFSDLRSSKHISVTER